MEINNEMKIIAFLSEYAIKLKDGSNYMETTLATAKKITNLFEKTTSEDRGGYIPTGDDPKIDPPMESGTYEYNCKCDGNCQCK